MRGGALFLSSSDALHLLDWLDRGVPVCNILLAIERAADARSKKQSRLPLTLGQAKRHLGKPTKGAFAVADEVAGPEDAPLDPLVRRIELAAADDFAGARLRDLAGALRALPLDAIDRVVQAASGLIRAFHVAVWQDLAEPDREALRAHARADLGDLRTLLDEVALTAIVEENARDSVRRRYDWLSTATVWDLLESWTPEGA